MAKNAVWLEGKNIPIPWSFSPDGRYLAYHDITVTSPGDYDLWILPVDASDPEHVKPGTPEVFLKTPAREGAPAFSPDGRWISYFSDESGELEVYVRPFHLAAGGKWQISTRGGSYSFWSRDGRALYYLAQDRRIMVVEYTAAGESFTPRTPRVWSETPILATGLGYEPLDLAPDGKRFAILPSEEAAEGERLGPRDLPAELPRGTAASPAVGRLCTIEEPPLNLDDRRRDRGSEELKRLVPARRDWRAIRPSAIAWPSFGGPAPWRPFSSPD